MALSAMVALALAAGASLLLGPGILTRSGGDQGLWFVGPIGLAAKANEQGIAAGKKPHARLGVMVQAVNRALADSLALDRPEGALVSGVDKGGPADKAGLKAGDVILGLNGQAVRTSGDLPALIGQASPGDKVHLDIWRQGHREVLTATLGDARDTRVSLGKVEPGLGQVPRGQSVQTVSSGRPEPAAVATARCTPLSTRPADSSARATDRCSTSPAVS